MSQISRLRDAEIANGNLIDADDLDVELNQLVSESNAQDTRLTSLESGVMTFAGVKSFSSAPRTDQIDEKTTNAGVTVDGVLHRDGAIRLNPVESYAPLADGEIGYDATAKAFKVMANGAARTVMHSGNLSYPRGHVGGPAPVYLSDSTIGLKAGLSVRNDLDSDNLDVTTNLTLVLSGSGANGLDTGSEASNTWYYVYLIKKSSDGTVAGLFSTVNEAASGSVTLPSGFDLKRQLPLVVRNDASGNLLPFRVASGWPHMTRVRFLDVEHAAPYRVLNAGTATSFTTVSLGLVPPVARLADLAGDCPPGGTSAVAVLRETGRSGNGLAVGRSNTGANDNHWAQSFYVPEFPVSTSQQVDYKWTGAGSLTLSVAGFTITEI